MYIRPEHDLELEEPFEHGIPFKVNTETETLEMVFDHLGSGTVKISIKVPDFDLAFAFTIYKVQGQTVPAAILHLSPPASLKLTFAELYVMFSRFPSRDNYRVFPEEHVQANKRFRALHGVRIMTWLSGFQEDGT